MILGFKRQFRPFVEDGSKRHTIRKGKRWRVGMRADLYVDPRQRTMELLFRARVVKVQSIRIGVQMPLPFPEFEGLRVREQGDTKWLAVWIDDIQLSPSEAEQFFYTDGFRAPGQSAVAQAARFWRKGLPFDGQIIHWDYDSRHQVKPVKPRKPRKTTR